jgi:S-adenosylmethionine/arginine decarboxylase-like enzyme
VETLLEGKVIVCRFDPALYITHRKACIANVMKMVFEKVEPEIYDELYDEWRKLGENIDELERFITKLERILGITILTLPRVDP